MVTYTRKPETVQAFKFDGTDESMVAVAKALKIDLHSISIRGSHCGVGYHIYGTCSNFECSSFSLNIGDYVVVYKDKDVVWGREFESQFEEG